MSTRTDQPTDRPNGPAEPSGATAPASFEWPQFPSLSDTGRDLPQLQIPGARTLVRDRWERLVTSIELSYTPEEVWSALVTPSSLKLWLAEPHGALDQPGQECVLDFEDGEFFLCRTIDAQPPYHLQYLWRWLGLGQATNVTWHLEPNGDRGTRVTVTEEAINPPWDWQTWNGGGWPGILDQLASYLRTGMYWRWPWRRMGPYAQIELPIPFFEGWDRLMSPSGLRFWLQVMNGELRAGEALTILMGDASGAVEMAVREIVQPGQSPPSFLPSINFTLNRRVWNTEVGGRLWMEPAGWGRSLLQVVHYNWENLPANLQLSERRILANFWAGAVRRASLMFGFQPAPAGPHSWS